jgi:hypothetical protein
MISVTSGVVSGVVIGVLSVDEEVMDDEVVSVLVRMLPILSYYWYNGVK